MEIDNYDGLWHVRSAEAAGQDDFGGPVVAWLREPVKIGVIM